MKSKETIRTKALKVLKSKINDLDYLSYSELDRVLSLEDLRSDEYYKNKEAFFKAITDISIINRDYEDYFDAFYHPFMVIDHQGVILDANYSICKIIGIDISQFLNKEVIDFIPNDKKSSFLQILDNEEIENLKDISFQKTSGMVYYSEIKVKKLNQNGANLYIIYLLDVKKEKKHQRTLLGNQNLLDLLADNLPDTLFLRTHDQKFSLLYLNHQIEKLTGYKKVDFLNGEKSLIDIFYFEDLNIIFQNIQDMITEKESYNIEYRIIDSRGKIKWVKEHGLPIFDPKTEDLVYVAGLISDQTETKETEKEFYNAKKELQELTSHIESIREEEKKSIAIQVHDELGQSLTALKLDLARLEKDIFPKSEFVSSKIEDMNTLIDDTINTIRRISSELRPAVLDHLGLASAIEWQAENFQERSKIRTILDIEDYNLNIEESKAIGIFRIFQETLTNILRHSEANIVKISLQVRGGDLELLITDNGTGIKEGDIKNPKSFGLIGIREKATSIGAKVKIQGFDNIGTSVKVTMPLL